MTFCELQDAKKKSYPNFHFLTPKMTLKSNI